MTNVFGKISIAVWSVFEIYEDAHYSVTNINFPFVKIMQWKSFVMNEFVKNTFSIKSFDSKQIWFVYIWISMDITA